MRLPATGNFTAPAAITLALLSGCAIDWSRIRAESVQVSTGWHCPQAVGYSRWVSVEKKQDPERSSPPREVESGELPRRLAEVLDRQQCHPRVDRYAADRLDIRIDSFDRDEPFLADLLGGFAIVTLFVVPVWYTERNAGRITITQDGRTEIYAVDDYELMHLSLLPLTLGVFGSPEGSLDFVDVSSRALKSFIRHGVRPPPATTAAPLAGVP